MAEVRTASVATAKADNNSGGDGGSGQSSSLLPEKWRNTVRRIDSSECSQAAFSLAQAFHADDLAKYLVGARDMAELSDERKWRLHVTIMRYIVAAHCYGGVVTTIGPDYEGVALWLPPGKSLDGWWTTFRSGMWRLYFQLSAEGMTRYMDAEMYHVKEEVMGDRASDCYVLNYLGTKPSGRGQGYARQLLEHMLRRADAERRPVYLESSSEANEQYYRKFGFDVRRHVWVGKEPDRVRLSIMVREPLGPK